MKSQDFPILTKKINKNPLVYLDNSATTQKPDTVINAISDYYRLANSNVHRGVHTLSQCATNDYEAVREKVKHFINAKSVKEVIFVPGTTAAINLVAQTFGRQNIKSGDEIIISEMEHHANIVPWQMLCEEVGASLKVIPVLDNGELDLDAYKALINKKTRLVAVSHVSNVLGTINPVKQIIATAHERHVPALVDGAQAAPHMRIDVQDLDCDFYAISSHKMYGPTGIGVLYGKQAFLENMPPYQGGGDMISRVTFEKTEYSKLPYKFEAGTPNIAGVVGFGAAIDYLLGIGYDEIYKHEQTLLQIATEKLKAIDGLRIIGEAKHRAAVISFVMNGIHPHDLGTILDSEGVAVRAGHHCAMPLMQRFNVPATVRASFGIYNQLSDIDALVSALSKAKEIFNV